MSVVQIVGKGIEVGLGFFSLFALAAGSIYVAFFCVIAMMQVIFWREREAYVRVALHKIRVLLRILAIKLTKRIIIYYKRNFD